MMVETQLKINLSNITKLPFQSYQNDFSFIINGQEFKTNKIVSDILSQNICKTHLNDPTFDEIIINTTNKGDFSLILNLLNFKKIQIPDKELPFILEVIDILGNDSFKFISPNNTTEITTDNIFTLINLENQQKLFPDLFYEKIDFLSSHFFELCETKQDEFLKLRIETLFSIIDNPKLQLNSEDQLLNFIIKLYSNDPQYSILFEAVYFTNISSDLMKEFISTYNFNDMTSKIWKRLSPRLINKPIEYQKRSSRYKRNFGSIFEKPENNTLSGIIDYLRKKSNGNIQNEISVLSNSCLNSDPNCQPISIVLYDDQSKVFRSKDQPGSWICIDFKNHKIMPTDYAIQSRNWTKNCGHPKNWVIEGSIDGNDWQILDQQQNFVGLNDANVVNTFSIKNQERKEFSLIRMRSIGLSCAGTNTLSFKSIEFYGEYI